MCVAVGRGGGVVVIKPKQKKRGRTRMEKREGDGRRIPIAGAQNARRPWKLEGRNC